MQDCGPPVAREGDPPPPYRWYSTEEAKNREQFGCPRCLDASTEIATPSGGRSVDSLRAGDVVWSASASGERVAVPVLRVTRVAVPETHRLVALRLADGRTVRVSAGHPLARGGVVGDLAVGSAFDGSFVTDRTLLAPEVPFTFDLLPAGETGLYWANGVLLGSTLH